VQTWIIVLGVFGILKSRAPHGKSRERAVLCSISLTVEILRDEELTTQADLESGMQSRKSMATKEPKLRSCGGQTN